MATADFHLKPELPLVIFRELPISLLIRTWPQSVINSNCLLLNVLLKHSRLGILSSFAFFASRIHSATHPSISFENHSFHHRSMVGIACETWKYNMTINENCSQNLQVLYARIILFTIACRGSGRSIKFGQFLYIQYSIKGAYFKCARNFLDLIFPRPLHWPMTRLPVNFMHHKSDFKLCFTCLERPEGWGISLIFCKWLLYVHPTVVVRTA